MATWSVRWEKLSALPSLNANCCGFRMCIISVFGIEISKHLVNKAIDSILKLQFLYCSGISKKNSSIIGVFFLNYEPCFELIANIFMIIKCNALMHAYVNLF